MKTKTQSTSLLTVEGQRVASIALTCLCEAILNAKYIPSRLRRNGVVVSIDDLKEIEHYDINFNDSIITGYFDVCYYRATRIDMGEFFTEGVQLLSNNLSVLFTYEEIDAE